MSVRRLTRLLGLLVVFLAVAVAPATGAGTSPGAPDRAEARQDHTAPARRTGEHLTATNGAHRVGFRAPIAARRVDDGGLPLLAVLADGIEFPGSGPTVAVPGDPGPTRRAPVLARHLGRGPPAV